MESQQSTTKTMNGPCNGYSNITSTSRKIPSFFGVCYVGIALNMKVVEATIVGQQINITYRSPSIFLRVHFSEVRAIRHGSFLRDSRVSVMGIDVF